MEKELPKVSHSGELKIGDYILKTHVLEDGRRIIEADSFNGFIEYMANGGDIPESAAIELAKFVNGK